MNQNSNEQQSDKRRRLSESFLNMWDGFPHPVLLLHKSRLIIDANQAARDLGVPLGVKCRDISPYPDKCKNHCQADKALADGIWKRLVSREKEKVSATYWIPIHAGEDGLYLHFTVDVPEA